MTGIVFRVTLENPIIMIRVVEPNKNSHSGCTTPPPAGNPSETECGKNEKIISIISQSELMLISLMQNNGIWGKIQYKS